MDLDQQALEAQNRQSEVMTTDAGVEFVRTPKTCFENLPDWPYEPQYVEIDGLRQAYVDVGPADAEETILLLHSQPSWSYLYRQDDPCSRASRASRDRHGSRRHGAV